MPRISELPNSTELTGDETIVIVQDGETRQVALTDALLARHPVSLNHIRWIKSSASPALLDQQTAILEISHGGC